VELVTFQVLASGTLKSALIFDAAHTPRGKRNGALAGVHPVDLYAGVLSALVERSGVDPSAVQDVLCGCVGQTGEQGGCLGRAAALAAGLPIEVPGMSLDRFCGSGLQALCFAAMAVQSGHMDLVLAGGVESMSRVPIGASWQAERSAKFEARCPPQTQFDAAERIAEHYRVTREDCDRFALGSQQRAATAWREGRFDGALLPVALSDASGGEARVTRDEHPRPGSTLDKLASLEPLREGGVLTAASASGVVDGAGALLVGNEAAASRHGLEPIARLVAMDVCGSDPLLMLTGPIPATRRVLAKAGIAIGEVACFEVNEAFAPIPIAWLRELGVDPQRVNPCGGAIALGHPLGATGAILSATLIGELRRRSARYGLVTICMGYGMGIAVLFERLG
jgi:acetyl-CoA acetyltransferase family protein